MTLCDRTSCIDSEQQNIMSNHCEGQLFDSVNFRQKDAKKVNQQIFVRLTPKQSLNTKVGQQVDISFWNTTR